MVTRWAIIRDGTVENIILWDGVTEWAPPEGTTVRALSAKETAGPGHSFNGKSFAPSVTSAETAQGDPQ